MEGKNLDFGHVIRTAELGDDSARSDFVIGLKRAMKRHFLKGQRAFTLIEALVGIVIFFVAVLSLMGFVPYSFTVMKNDDVDLQAVAAGQQYMDMLRGAIANGTQVPAPPKILINGGDSVMGNSTGLNADTSPGYFAISGSCTPSGQDGRLYDCVVLVQWNDQQNPKSYTVESYAAQQSS